MRESFCDRVERGRINDGRWQSERGQAFGAFKIRLPRSGRLFFCIVGNGAGWDHVSVSLSDRCPTWEEMCAIKELFFRDDEWVLQYHPAKADYVNNHPYALHLWRPHDTEIPRPPQVMV